MQVKDRAFILKVTKYGESDLIVRALNTKGARINLFARGALRSRKRFGGGILEPTHYVQLEYVEKRARDLEAPLHTLKEATLVEGFEGLRTDYKRLETALFCVQLVSEVAREEDEHAVSLFNLLGHTLRAAQASNALDKLRIQFSVKLLTYQGVLPHEREETVLANTPITKHESVEFQDLEWRTVKFRAQKVLTEFLGHVPPW